jgi:hypothetical protein
MEKPLATIDEIESMVKFRLPADYRIYLQNYSGFEGFIGQEFVKLWDLDQLVENNREYGILSSLPKTLGIGGNGSSEFIAIEPVAENRCRIVLSPFIDLNRNHHIEIGTSFTDFLVRLDKGQEWYT